MVEILGNFHVQDKYLGLPLKFGQLKREDEYVLIDKVA
jgi:hypothetical protein